LSLIINERINIKLLMRLLHLFSFFVFTFFVSSGLMSCKDTQTGTEIIFPNSNVSYSKHVGPLFQQKCTSSPCHGGSAPQPANNPLNLEYPSYITLINHIPTLVIPRDTNCLLIEHLNGRLLQMPPPYSPQLNQNQINGVKKWIEEGAAEN
jgi:hypothetical protein